MQFKRVILSISIFSVSIILGGCLSTVKSENTINVVNQNDRFDRDGKLFATDVLCYNEYAQLINEKIISKDSELEISYFYDNNGRLVSKVSKRKSLGNKIDILKSKYTYSDDGKEVEIIESENGNIYYEIKLLYENNILKKKMIKYANSKMSILYNLEYKTNKIIRYSYINDSILHDTETFIFDDEKKLIKIEYKSSECASSREFKYIGKKLYRENVIDNENKIKEYYIYSYEKIEIFRPIDSYFGYLPLGPILRDIGFK